MFGQPVLDPTGNTPLAAEVPFRPDRDLRVSISVTEPDGSPGPSRDLPVSGSATEVKIPVLGLFPDRDNQVAIAVLDADGKEIGTRTFTISTAPLPDDFPTFEVAGEHDSRVFTLFEYLRTPMSRAEGLAIMVDHAKKSCSCDTTFSATRWSDSTCPSSATSACTTTSFEPPMATSC